MAKILSQTAGGPIVVELTGDEARELRKYGFSQTPDSISLTLGCQLAQLIYQQRRSVGQAIADMSDMVSHSMSETAAKVYEIIAAQAAPVALVNKMEQATSELRVLGGAAKAFVEMAKRSEIDGCNKPDGSMLGTSFEASLKSE